MGRKAEKKSEEVVGGLGWLEGVLGWYRRWTTHGGAGSRDSRELSLSVAYWGDIVVVG